MKAPALQRSVTVVREGGREEGRLRDVGEGGRKRGREGDRRNKFEVYWEGEKKEKEGRDGVREGGREE